MSTKPKHALSRSTRNALIAAVFFILMPVLIVVDHRYGDAIRHYVEQLTYSTADRQRYHGKVFSVVEVVDGDTILIDAPDGDDPVTRVRLIGVDTPETKHPTVALMYYGPEATAFTSKHTFGKEVTILLDTVTEERDRYNRLLAYIVLPDGRILNEELIRNGFGYAYLSFPHSQSLNYEALMEEAIETKTGLWEKATRNDLPKWLRSKRPELLRHH